jgi:ABC-type anion transport system duplicated permease subunit
MGALSFLNPTNWSKKGAKRSIEDVISALDGGSWGASMSGEPVNLTTALRVSTVLAFFGKSKAENANLPPTFLSTGF